MPPSFPLLHPINLADIHLSPFYEPAHVTSTSLTWHEPTYLLSPFILPPSSFWAMSSLDFFSHNMSPSANSNPHTRHTNGWDTFDQWNISDEDIPRTTSENIDARPESPSEQTKDDPQHTTQHPLPNPFRAHSDDTVKWTAEDADRAKKDGLDVKEGENMSKLHYFEHTATTFLHTLIRDNIPAHPHPRQNTERAEREGRSFQTRQVNSQALEVAVKRGHSLLSIVGRMVKEATLTKYGCGEKSSWLEALLESERELGSAPFGRCSTRNDSGHHHKHAPPSPLVILQPAPTLSHLRLVFTSSLSHVKVGEYYIDVLMEENVLSSSSSISTLSRTSPNCSRRMSDGKREESKQQQALLNDRLLSPPNNWKPHQQHRISTPCEESMIVLKLMKRIECLGRLFGYLEQGLAESFDIQNSKTSSPPSSARASLSSTPSSAPQQGRESSEQFAEHAEFELLVIDYCVKICTTSFNGIALVFSFFNVAPFLSTVYPLSSTVQPDDSLLARSAPRQKTQSPVPLVSISRIESALSHPISFPKAHCVIVSLGSLIPLFASNQIFPLSIGPRSFLYQNQINRYNRSATTKDNFDVLNHLFKVFLRHAPTLPRISPLRPDESHSHPHRQVEHFCFISRRTRRCQDGDVGPDQANVAVRREKTRSREEVERAGELSQSKPPFEAVWMCSVHGHDPAVEGRVS
ncbi:hypothetical protein BLNAU_21589 [Blattamonas nauphoetae]|uniref:Uncharacterized protein n=1 Tax=Blattamonas nauphoetae TaxID=2049346 RepID=A0ABQ9WXQ3_9EUKA|nr:hypothetical protein BLNAU_21589 [Blattamonas nauphoetae]